MNRGNSKAVHHHVICDSCNKSPIRGDRYKCTHPECPDFDLCANCESDPIPRHPVDHLLLKIRQPRSSLFGAASSGVPQAVRRAQEIAQRYAGGSCSQQTNHQNPIAAILSSIGAAVNAHTASSTSSSTSSAPSTPDVKASAVSEKAETTPVGTQVDEEEVEEKGVESEVESKQEGEEVVETEETPLMTEVKVESESESEDEDEEEKIVVKEEERLGCSFVADVS